MTSALEDRWRDITLALKHGHAIPPYRKYHTVTILCPRPSLCQIDVNIYGTIGRVPGMETVQRILVISHIRIEPQASGHFWTFLYLLMDLPRFRDYIDVIMIWRVNNPPFKQTLLRNGWIEEYGDFYLRL